MKIVLRLLVLLLLASCGGGGDDDTPKARSTVSIQDLRKGASDGL